MYFININITWGRVDSPSWTMKYITYFLFLYLINVLHMIDECQSYSSYNYIIFSSANILLEQNTSRLSHSNISFLLPHITITRLLSQYCQKQGECECICVCVCARDSMYIYYNIQAYVWSKFVKVKITQYKTLWNPSPPCEVSFF